jgi:N-acyl-D-aspartate/D-glutamate deacylase
MTYDTIIKGGRGSTAPALCPPYAHLGLREGVVQVVSPTPLDETGCREVVDATGRWVLPGIRAR